MKYITTKCSNCGYRTRNHDSDVPKVQIGAPILRCPKCGHLILDTIQTEYEFMTDKEKASFSTQAALPKSYIGNALFIIVGLVLLIGGLSVGETYTFVGLICGGGCIAMGIYQIIHNQKVANYEMIEQAVYESLQRTNNSKYVEYIKDVYAANGIKRNYQPYSNKTEFINQYKKFELRESYKTDMYLFNEFLESVGIEEPIEQNNVSTFIQH